MKILNTEKIILSLEDVRRVDLHSYEDKQTSRGKSCVITEYTVLITYVDHSTERLPCGKDENGHATAKLLMDKIFAILSEKS